MILFNCSCGGRHSFFHPCNGTIDINSASSDAVSDTADAIALNYVKDVEEEKNYGWSEK